MKIRENFPPEIQCKTDQQIKNFGNFTKKFSSLKVKIKNEKYENRDKILTGNIVLNCQKNRKFHKKISPEKKFKSE